MGSVDGKVRRKSIFCERHRSGLKCKVQVLEHPFNGRHGQAWLAYVVVTMMGFNDGNPAKLYLPRDYSGAYCGVASLSSRFVCVKLYMRDTFFSQQFIMNASRFLTLQRLMENGVPPCQTKETNWNSGPNTLDFPSLSFTMRLGQQNTHVGGTCDKRQMIRNHREM